MPIMDRKVEIMLDHVRRSQLYIQNSLESTYEGKFMRKHDEETWEFLEDLSWMTVVREFNWKISFSSLTSKDGFCSLDSSMLPRPRPLPF